MTSSVEIFTYLVARIRPAVTNKAAAARQREHEAADFGGKWMMLPVACKFAGNSDPLRGIIASNSDPF